MLFIFLDFLGQIIDDSCHVLLCVLTVIMSLQGFCRLLKTVKVDVDSSGKKCKERMMKVLIETPSFSSFGNRYKSQTCDGAEKWNKCMTLKCT